MKGTILLMTAAASPAAGCAAQVDESVDTSGIPFGNGFLLGYHGSLNLSEKKGHVTCSPCTEGFPESGDGDGAVIRSSDGITLKRAITQI